MNKTIIFKSFFYSLIIFCVISYISVMISLLSSTTVNSDSNPVVNIGFPFKYYYQFWVGNPFPNNGWNIRYFIYDFLITYGITFFYILLFKKEK